MPSKTDPRELLEKLRKAFEQDKEGKLSQKAAIILSDWLKKPASTAAPQADQGSVRKDYRKVWKKG